MEDVAVSKTRPSRGSSEKTSVGSRAFQRRTTSERTRAARRQATRRRLAFTGGGSPLQLRAAFARIPTAAWMCALIALLNGAAWSLVTPPFQGRDEPAHFAYVQLLAETGSLPHTTEGEQSGNSPEEALVLEGVHQQQIKLSPEVKAISSQSEQRVLSHDLGAGLSRVGSEAAGVATSEPPLYYAIETIPYALGGGNTLTQLELMRLLGALLAAITAMLAFFFIREVLPGVPWAATIGAACVALQPLFGFMSGTVNPDTMLYAVTAGVLLCLARGFRRGLTRRLALATGALIAAGFLTKLNFVGIAPGAFLGLLLLGLREARAKDARALREPAIAALIGASPVLIYILVNGLSSHPAVGSTSQAALSSSGGSIFKEIDYVWELYLPTLPGMTHYFAGMLTPRDIWFDRFVGLYGWLDTQFPGWVENIALVLAAAIALLCGRELVVRRKALSSRVAELATYATMTVGIMLLVGATSYASRSSTGGVEGFGDPRYLLPMLPLLGVVVALAARGAGRRWAPSVGALILVLFLAHDLFSQLQTIARYYG
jgi:hypothetical protein